MKRTISILLSLFLLLSLISGCAKNDVPDETKPAGTEKAAPVGTEPAQTEKPEPARTETAEPVTTEAPAPTETDSSEAGRTALTGDSFTLGLPQGDGIATVEFGSPISQPSGQPVENQPMANQPNTLVQLTIEDIQAMNGDNLVIDIYNNEGYLSTLVGKFYEGKVNNYEDGVESIRGLASLLGLTKGCEFFAVYGETDNDGYTYYTYQQRYGVNTLQYATLRICVDPQGYTAGLTCSFVPNAGTASQTPSVTAQQAEQFIQSNSSYRVISGRTVQLAACFNSVVYNCWVVYSDNPDQSASFDMPYLAHYISTDGSYLISIPCASFATDNKELMNNDHYFDNLTPQNVSFTIQQPTGSKKTISVPISKNSKDGKYYLMDPSRKIAVAQYKDFAFQGNLNFVSSSSANSGWSDKDLMAYFNYINAYDFYASKGIHSVDGFNTPLLITRGYCDQQGNPVDNACFYGINSGWACFAASDANNYSYCADVCGHEFTHGVTSTSMQGIFYQNETGAINEAYSDIMGNLCEKITGQTTDTGWLISEMCGNESVFRDMADPNHYKQPAFVGDVGYVSPVLAPASANDNGGVHLNNTLVSQIAAKLDAAGMTLDQQFSMWSTSIELLTPKSDYEDLHGILLFSLKINGMLQEFGPALNKAFAEAGLNDDWNSSYTTATKAGCGRVSFQVDGYVAGQPGVCYFADASGAYTYAFPDRNGTVSVLLPAGDYRTAYEYTENEGKTYVDYYFDGSNWTKTGGYGSYTVRNGAVMELPAINSGNAVSVGGGGSTDPTPAPSGQEGEELSLVSYNGGYFTMLIPEGWAVETSGYYGCFGFKLYDPSNPSRQVFFNGALAPFHKSEASRRYLSYYDTTGGMIANGPVLSEPSVKGITDCWDYCIEYQKRYEGKQLFTTMNNINLVAVSQYQGRAADYGIETVGVGLCYDQGGQPCILGIASTLVDMDVYGYYGGNWYYTCMDMLGVLLPYDEFDLYFVDLLICAMSIQFSQDYIDASQYSSLPMASNEEIADGMEAIAEAIYGLYEQVA